MFEAIRVKTFRVCTACKSGSRLSVFSSLQRTQHAGDVVGSQAWADGRTKINVALKNIHTLFFLVIGDKASGTFQIPFFSLFFLSLYLITNAAMHVDPSDTCLILSLLSTLSSRYSVPWPPVPVPHASASPRRKRPRTEPRAAARRSSLSTCGWPGELEHARPAWRTQPWPRSPTPRRLCSSTGRRCSVPMRMEEGRGIHGQIHHGPTRVEPVGASFFGSTCQTSLAC